MTLPLYEVTKQCSCGVEWVGPAFQPEPNPRSGRCPTCLAKEDGVMDSLVHPVRDSAPPVVNLQRQPRVGEADYD